MRWTQPFTYLSSIQFSSIVIFLLMLIAYASTPPPRLPYIPSTLSTHSLPPLHLPLLYIPTVLSEMGFTDKSMLLLRHNRIKFLWLSAMPCDIFASDQGTDRIMAKRVSDAQRYKWRMRMPKAIKPISAQQSFHQKGFPRRYFKSPSAGMQIVN